MAKVTHHGYLGFQQSGQDLVSDAVGGIVIQALADTGQTLLTGQAVYWVDSGEVATSATAATVGALLAGYVVGGQYLGDDIPLNTAGTGNTIGLTAATAGQRVLIQTDGIVNAIGGAAITAGARVIGDSTAGRVITDPGAGAVWIMGICIEDCSGAAAVAKLQIRNYLLYR